MRLLPFRDYFDLDVASQPLSNETAHFTFIPAAPSAEPQESGTRLKGLDNS